MSVRNWHFGTAGGIAMRFLREPDYCMTWIWTLHRAHNKSKSPFEEDNTWATLLLAGNSQQVCYHAIILSNRSVATLLYADNACLLDNVDIIYRCTEFNFQIT